MAVWFVSDLHLCAERPRATEVFRRFLAGPARAAEALYILGDLVEYWIGDDTLQREPPDFVPDLHALTAAGVPAWFMHGNRDFLVGRDFAKATGCTLLDDPAVIDLYGTRALLMHGDTLCTDDTAYQAFRRQVRDPAWQKDFLAKDWEARTVMAKSARSESQRQTQAKPEYIVDVNQRAVEAAMRAAGVHLLIHGHTHRPGTHTFMLDGRPAQRIVLADWYESASALRVDAQGLARVALD